MTSAFISGGCSRCGPNEATMAPSPLLPKENGAIVLRTKVDPQPTLWEAILPPEFSVLPPGLARIDRLLDDPVFFEPFVPFFNPVIGRPSIPIETYLRMMFLRFRYRLGFETLCGEVTDSLTWRRFCRIGLTDAVPDPSTLMKITTRCGEVTVGALNQRLLEKANAAHLIKVDKVRADTTVIPANVAYPTDSGLLAKGVAKLTKTVGAIKAAGLARRTRFRDRTRSVRRRAHQMAAWLRRRSGEAKDEVLTLTGELATIAEAAIKEAQNVAINARRGLRRAGEGASGRATSLVTELERTIGVLEFGFKAQVVDNADGIVLDHCVEMGNRRRTHAGAGHRPHQKVGRQSAGKGHRRPGLWRVQGGSRAALARGQACGHPQKRSSRCGTTSGRVLASFPQVDQVAHRFGGSHLLSQAFVGLGAHPARWDRWRPHMVWLGHPRPQRHQDRRAHR